MSTVVTSTGGQPVKSVPPRRLPQSTPSRQRPKWAARMFWLAISLPAAWLVPVVMHAAALDWVLPLLIVGVMASLVRGATTMIDRLMVALALTFGGTCVAGLLISVWPPRLHPVPVAGLAFTILAVGAAVTGRRPSIPLRMRLADLWLLASATACAVIIVTPFWVRDLGGRLGLVAPGEDFARHFIVYDTIGLLGGYLFLYPAQASLYEQDGYGLVTYPQGTHFTYALLDRFLRSAATSGDGVTAMDSLIWFYVGTFAFFCLSVLWAIRRIGGPALSTAVAVPLFAAAAVYLCFGDPVTIFLRGFPNELASLGLLAILLALLARPLYRTGDQIVAVGALLVGISFSYYMFLTVAGAAVLGWVFVHRCRLWRRWLLTLVVGAAAAGLAWLPLAVNPKRTNAEQLLLPGAIIPVDRQMTAVLVALAAAGVLLRGLGRATGGKVLFLSLLAAGGLVWWINDYQQSELGTTIYYYEKAYHQLIVVAMVATGACVSFLPRLAGRYPQLTLIRPATAVAVCVAAYAIFGSYAAPDLPIPGRHHGVALWQGTTGESQGGSDAIRIMRAAPSADEMVTVSLMHGERANYYATLYAAVMQRNYRHAVLWYVYLAASHHRWSVGAISERVARTDRPVRFIVSDRDVGWAVRKYSRDGLPAKLEAYEIPNVELVAFLAARYPDQVKVVYLPDGD